MKSMFDYVDLKVSARWEHKKTGRQVETFIANDAYFDLCKEYELRESHILVVNSHVEPEAYDIKVFCNEFRKIKDFREREKAIDLLREIKGETEKRGDLRRE